MVNYAPLQPIPAELSELKSEINSYLFNFLGVSTEEEAIASVLSNKVRIMIYRSIPSYALPYVAPTLNDRMLAPLVAKYGPITDSSIWACAPMSLTPIISAPDRKANLIIPALGGENLRLQWYNYTGTQSMNTSSNNGVDMVNVYLPNEPDLLTKDNNLVGLDTTWVRVNKFHNISNWSNNLCVYMSVTFENQDLLEQELLAV